MGAFLVKEWSTGPMRRLLLGLVVTSVVFSIFFTSFFLLYWYPTSQEIKSGAWFVGIASYRDPECRKTLTDLFTQADRPNKLVIGLHEQHLPEDKSCLPKESECPFHPLCPFLAQIRHLKTDPNDAKGPVYARHHMQKLMQGEEFYMHVDSHTSFRTSWDTELLKNWR